MDGRTEGRTDIPIVASTGLAATLTPCKNYHVNLGRTHARTDGQRHGRTTRKHIASAGAYRRRRLNKTDILTTVTHCATSLPSNCFRDCFPITTAESPTWPMYILLLRMITTLAVVPAVLGRPAAVWGHESVSDNNKIITSTVKSVTITLTCWSITKKVESSSSRKMWHRSTLISLAFSQTSELPDHRYGSALHGVPAFSTAFAGITHRRMGSLQHWRKTSV